MTAEFALGVDITSFDAEDFKTKLASQFAGVDPNQIKLDVTSGSTVATAESRTRAPRPTRPHQYRHRPQPRLRLRH